jgi:hypothetical protein
MILMNFYNNEGNIICPECNKPITKKDETIDEQGSICQPEKVWKVHYMCHILKEKPTVTI